MALSAVVSTFRPDNEIGVLRAVSTTASRTSCALKIAADWYGPIGVLSVSGDIDASNADDFVGRAIDRMWLSRTLIVDLRGVTFFGLAGFTALCSIEESRNSTGASWLCVPSARVRRLLNLCDSGEPLPVAESMDAAWIAAKKSSFLP